MLRFCIIVCFILVSAVAFSQQPELLWKKIFGGSLREARPWILGTDDGGYILAGYGNSVDGDFTGTTNIGGDDIQIIKTDPCGNLIWSKQYGGSGFEEVRGFVYAPDGGYLITGRTSSTDIPNGNGRPTNGLACKIDKDGNMQWMRAYGGASISNFDHALFLPDTSCIIIGANSVLTAGGDLQGWVVKLDKNGALMWEKKIGSAASEVLASVVKTPDGNFMACGYYALQTNNSNFWLVKFDMDGNRLWEKIWGGSQDETAYKILSISTGGFVVLGQTLSPEIVGYHGSTDITATRIDESGNIIWQKCFGGSSADQAYSFSILPNDNIVFTANTRSSDGDIPSPNRGGNDAFAFMTDINGNVLWRQTFGGSLPDMFTGVLAVEDNSLIFAGTSSSNNGDISGNHGSSDFILFKFRPVIKNSIDSSSCKPISINNRLVTRDSIWKDTLHDGCGYDSVIYSYDIKVAPVPSVNTIGNTMITQGQSIVLNTQANGPVEWIGPGLSCYYCLSPVAHPNNTSTYIVKTGTGECQAADTVVIEVLKGDTLYIPSAFTPNGDGNNDVFKPIGLVTDYQLKIFNRWGNKIFESRSLPEGWDGRYNGEEQSTGVFIYWINYKTVSGISKMQKGTLILIR